MPKILVVDDEEKIRHLVKTYLGRAGYVVNVASDGHEASQLASTWTPDLVLTDIVMPEKEGFELIRDLRRENPAIRIIAMSGGGRNNSETYLKIATYLGADHILPKPFSLADLLQAVDQVLSD